VTIHETKDHITVCICTFKRPQLLATLLGTIESLALEGLFTISVCIVDNDSSQSAWEVVSAFSRGASIPVRYVSEPEQNIARARNRAVENAEGSHIAFIDDDEIPEERWLTSLYGMWKKTNASGVLGPVLPLYQAPPPSWIVKGKILERPAKKLDTRTGNVLLERRLFDQEGHRFNVNYGRGGEDREFFRRMVERGEQFVWCNEAVVREIIPASRCSRSFQMRRALLRGKVAMPVPFKGLRRLLKSTLVICLYLALLLLLLPISHGLFMKYLIRTCDHLGSILAFFGINIISENYLS
jgi:succinoglycan biosynthesis protein ExoM